LKSVPAVVGSLQPPASDQDLERWAEVVGHPLPQLLKELYAVHDGSAVIGGNGFSFVGGWYPLPIGRAIEAFVRYDPLTHLWALPTAVPFAADYTGCNLAVRVDGTDGVLDCFNDSPPGRGFDSIKALMAQTVEGLRGKHQKYRPTLSAKYLLWVNRDLEKGDLGSRV
jgi:hypothetical protein